MRARPSMRFRTPAGWLPYPVRYPRAPRPRPRGHGGVGGPAWLLPAVRELGHLRQSAAAAGFKLKRVRPERPTRVSEALDRLADSLHEAARTPEATPYYLLVESLLDRFTAAEVAGGGASPAGPRDLPKGCEGRSERRRGPQARPKAGCDCSFRPAGATRSDPESCWGAITSESTVPGNRIGRIDVRESHSLVGSLRESDARTVIGALNGTTLGGRSLRVDYDRAKDQRPRGKPPGGRPRRPSRPGASGTSGRRKKPAATRRGRP